MCLEYSESYYKIWKLVPNMQLAAIITLTTKKESIGVLNVPQTGLTIIR